MIACPACGHGNDDAGKFCSECGAQLIAPTTPSRQVRKAVTVVFCDVTGSTPWARPRAKLLLARLGG